MGPEALLHLPTPIQENQSKYYTGGEKGNFGVKTSFIH